MCVGCGVFLSCARSFLCLVFACVFSFLLVCYCFCLCACVIAFVWLFILSNCFIVCVSLFRNGIIGLVGDGVLFEIMLDDDVSGGGAFLVRCSTTP